jgi:hypothetical protein
MLTNLTLTICVLLYCCWQNRIQTMKRLVVLGLILFLSPPLPAYGADDCGFGYSYDYESLDDDCVGSKWEVSKESDGFVNSISLIMYPDEEGPNADSDSESYIEIRCIKKTLQVYVWVEYADSFGFDGTGQYRIDNGKAITFSYRLQKDLDGVILKSPKTFLAAFAKSKSRATFKIPSVEGYEIVVYPKADLLSHRGLFASRGCKF